MSTRTLMISPQGGTQLPVGGAVMTARVQFRAIPGRGQSAPPTGGELRRRSGVARSEGLEPQPSDP